MACANPDIVRIGIDAEDFKDLFKRGFNYLPVYSAATTYNTSDIVFYSDKFYSCKNDNTIGQLPTDTAFWSIATGISQEDYILDEDIDNAFNEACMKFKPSNFDNDSDIKLGYLYLTAHFLVEDLRAGGTDSSDGGLVTSRSVGNVSESMTVPEWMQKPQYSFYATTYYGRKYINMIYNRTRGAAYTVWSGTNA